jgi:hypothetical protein
LVARFYFHLINDLDVPDLEGMEFSDLDTARAGAIEQARGMIGEQTKEGAHVVLHHHIDIEDERGTVVDTVWFRDVVNIGD